MKRLFFIVVTIVATLTATAQRKVTLDLNRTVALATDSSLAAEKYRSVLDTYRFAFLAWQASRKPQITLESTPLQYEQYMVQRYISEEDRDTYREQQMLYSEAAVGMTQDIEALGGTLYASTGLGFLHTFGGDTNYDEFTSVPIKVGYRQDLLGFNALKWNKRLEPIKLKKAEKAYAYNIESAAAQAVDLFFQLALAQDQLRMAEENLQTCDTIYAIACRRFKIASISKAELSILDLQRINAANAMENAIISRNEASRRLASFLGMEHNTDIELIIPTIYSPVKVDAEEAIRYARENNPVFIETRHAVEEARMEMEKAKVERRISLNIDASIGLNQVADNFWDAYQKPLRQEKAMVTLSVPLKDWGKRKNNYLQAQSRLETAEKELSETTRDTELDVVISVDDYNKRHDLTENSRKSLNIAQEAYDAMLTRFIKGQAPVNDLSLAQHYWHDARQNYTQSLQNYWTAFYRLRQLTLYDFNRHEIINHKSKQ